MRVGSLFSGIGGIELGLERAGGFETAWFVEWKPYAQEVLKERWPEAMVYGDIRTIDWTAVEPVEVLSMGFPCQPHSVAGLRRASADERDMWPECFKAICALKPRWIVAENVPGILSSESGRFFGRILADLARSGYDAEWRVVRAADIGAPHRRERIILLAYPAGTRRERVLCDWPERGEQESSGWAAVALDSSRGPFAWLQRAHMGEPAFFRNDDGLSCRVERLECIGNAVVPGIAQEVGKAILKAER